MEQKKNELKIEIAPDVATGVYSNLAVINHSPNEVVLDFINVVPGMPQAKVQTRVIMTPENAKNLMLALRDNIGKYESVFGEIVQRTPKSRNNEPRDPRNPFMTGGQA